MAGLWTGQYGIWRPGVPSNYSLSMTKIDNYRKKLKSLESWDSFLKKESGLPGPRGNLELAQAIADVGERSRFEHFLALDNEKATTNSPEGYLVFCGVVGLGKLIVEGKTKYWDRLRPYASDSRWRIREAVAIALQRVGDADMDGLLNKMEIWKDGDWLEKRAVAAALAEPRLLNKPDVVIHVLQIFDKITVKMESTTDSKSEGYKVLRQAMGYCWSVAVAALPKEGKRMMEKWLKSQSPDVHWMMKENLKKNRLVKMDAEWVKSKLGSM
jgi:hypothetical protein